MNPLAFYKCLADDTRLQSLLLLADGRQLCVCELMDALQLSQPKVSRHLAELRECGIVQGERRGRWVYYCLAPGLPDWAREVLLTTAAAAPGYLKTARRRLAASTCTPA
ncbi:metalloregulator ArsR/SmtB family transcription factor [Parahaliea mediterranea]|uniref:metalloregulator ArsR/SmtB family transcription factor n=1 Tax=Parahaliea mediterranea TaxID=651086 RepID=UPI000E2FDAB4|nr:metalloregulator ArsR/SmtB family transcription factor [Parahaliea mediterranea]